jgi:hypothetical protein
VSSDASLQKALTGQIDSATNAIAAEIIPSNPHLRLAASRIDDLNTTLTALGTEVTAVSLVNPGAAEELFSQCATTVVTATEATQAAKQSDGFDQFLALGDLLSADDDGLLTSVESACIQNLNTHLADPGIAAQGGRLRQIRAEMERDFVLVEPLALRQAQKEMAVVERTLNTLIHELNIISVSPIVGLDVARIGAEHSRSETMYGIGGGIRITLVNSADFTAAYFANVSRRTGEPSGAFLFSLRFRDLLE